MTGASRAWEFGDEQPIDVVRTLRNAVLQEGRTGFPVRMHADDVEVVEVPSQPAHLDVVSLSDDDDVVATGRE